MSPYSIVPEIHGGAVRMANLLRRLARTSDVRVLVFLGGTDDPPQRAALESFCRGVYFQELPAGGSEGATGIAAVDQFSSPAVHDRIRALVQAHAIDVVHLEYTELGQFAPACTGSCVVLTEHDLSFVTHGRRAAVGMQDTGAGQPERWLEYERRVCERVAQVHVMSSHDADLLAGQLGDGGDRIRVIPNGVDTRVFTPPRRGAGRRGLLFLGSFPHRPNLDALRYFLAEIWPRVRALEPELTLTVAGARPPVEVTALDGSDGVVVVGEVDRVAPLYRSHRALVVPLRAGSGTRLKVLEAMACGLPVVSTSLGVEGLPLRDHAEALVADEPEGFAKGVAEVVTDRELAERLARQGRAMVVKHFDWDVVARSLRSAHGELLVGRTPRELPRRSRPHLGRMPPSVTVAVLGSADEMATRGTVELALDQELANLHEVMCVVPTVSRGQRRWLRGRGVRVVVDEGERVSRGRLLNLAAAAAGGWVIAFVGAGARPAGRQWLDRLTIPFFLDGAPSATAGLLRYDGQPPPPALGTLAERWAAAHGAAEFSALNGALRRDVWEAFPFREDTLLEDQRWQRTVHASHHLVLPCPEAEVALGDARPGDVGAGSWAELATAWEALWPEGRTT